MNCSPRTKRTTCPWVVERALIFFLLFFCLFSCQKQDNTKDGKTATGEAKETEILDKQSSPDSSIHKVPNGDRDDILKPNDSTLCLVLSTGDTVTFRDTLQGTDNDRQYKHEYKGYLEKIGYFIVERVGWEWADWLIISKANGKKHTAISVPILSPDSNRLLCYWRDIEAGFLDNGFQIWHVSNDSLMVEYQLYPVQWGPEVAKWINAETIAFQRIAFGENGDFVYTPDTLRLSKKIWQTSGQSISVLPIPRDRIPLGCGCSFSFWYSGNNLDGIFAVLDNSSDRMRMNINSTIVRVNKIKYEHNAAIKGEETVGDKIKETWQYEDFTIDLDYTISFVCPKDSQGGCEVTRYEGRMTVKTKGYELTIPIKGDCGC